MIIEFCAAAAIAMRGVDLVQAFAKAESIPLVAGQRPSGD